VVSIRNLVRGKLSLLCIVGILSGCAGSGGNKSADVAEPVAGADTARLTNDFSRSKLIAADFVATMTQIPSTNPASTILHTTRPNTRFGELLLGALQNAGFDLRIGDESSAFWLDYAASLDAQSSDTGNPVYTFIVAAGEVKLKRSYEVDQYGVWPAGNMFVRGADASNVVMDDSIFSNRPKPELKLKREPVTIAASEFDDDNVTLQAVPSPKPFVKTRKIEPRQAGSESAQASVAQRELAESVAALAPLRENARENAGLNLPSAPTPSKAPASPGDYSEFSNLYDTRESRYQQIFQNYDVVDSRVMVFPNDSLVLGRVNKQSVRSYLDQFDPNTDLISVIGCSHGATNLENGNGYLANGRAFRVKEEFVSAGFASDKVLEEGCWASQDFPEMPTRGVLVQHRRLVNLN